MKENCYDIFLKDGSKLKIYGDYNTDDGVFRFFEEIDGIKRVYIFPIESIVYVVGDRKSVV